MNYAVIPQRSNSVTRDEMCVVACLQCDAVAGMRALGCFDIVFEKWRSPSLDMYAVYIILCNFVIDLLLRGSFHCQSH